MMVMIIFICDADREGQGFRMWCMQSAALDPQAHPSLRSKIISLLQRLTQK